MQIFLEGNFMKFLMRLPCSREKNILSSRREYFTLARVKMSPREDNLS